MLHRGEGASAEHVRIVGQLGSGEIAAVRCDAAGRAIVGARLERLSPADWPALGRLLARR